MTRFSGIAKGSVLALGVAAYAVIFMVGCGDDGNKNPPITSDKAYLRVVHLSADAPAVDIFVNGQTRAVQDLMFQEGTDYLELDEGTYTFDIVPAGGTIDDSVLTIADLALEGEKRYTAFAYGELVNLQAMALEDDFGGLDMGDIRVRAIHAAPGVGEVDIWNIPETGDPSPLYENVPYGVAGGYLDIPEGAYKLGFDVDNDANPDLTFSLPALSGGTIANVFAVSDGGGVFLFAQLQDSATVRFDADPIVADSARIRVLHLSPDAPPVDVWVDASLKAVEALGFPSSTGYLDIDAGTYDFQISASGSGPESAVLTIDNLTLEADKSYTAIAYDNLSSIKALALEDDTTAPAAGNIRVRAIHTAAGVGQVDIWNIPEMGDPSPLYENVDFGVAGGYLELPAGAYTLGFDVDDDANPDLTFSLPALPAGTIANVFATTDDMGAVFLNAQLIDGATVRIDPDSPVVDYSFIRVLHLSPDAPAVDIWVDGIGRAVEALAFPDGTDYLQLESDTYTFRVLPAGGDVGQSVLNIENLPLMADGYYTAVAYDELGTIQALALEDDFSGLAADEIRIRAIHAAVGVGQVDIWNIPESGAPGLLYENVDFGVVGNYIDLPAGAYTIGFDVDDDASPDVVFNVPELAGGTIANVFAVTDDMGALSLKAQLDSSAIAGIMPAMGNVRVLHLSPDAGLVDVYVNGALSPVTDLGFQEGTGYLELMQSTYDFDIAPAGRPIGEAVLSVASLPVMDTRSYTAVAFDFAADIMALWLEDDYESLAADTIRVRAIHTASAVGQVDIWNIPENGAPGMLYENVDFGVAGGYYDLPAGAYTIGFDVDDDSSPDVVFDLPALAGGTVANVFAVSDDMGNVFLTAQLNDGTTARIDPTL